MELLTPVLPSLLGGLAMGVLATGRLVVSGRVLGISGAVKGLVWGDQSPWRWLFLSGLLSGGVALLPLAPAAFEVMPHTIEPARVLLAGLLVGIGTSLGNGCTSGHGICGNARLSPRSFVSTLTFMLAGAAAASTMHTAALLGTPMGFMVVRQPPPELFTLAKIVLGASVAWLATATAVSAALIRRESPGECSVVEQPSAKWLGRVSDYISGFLFALALGASGMLRPSVVAGFLSIFSGTFDPSLIFVMGGALAVALPGYQLVTRAHILRRPFCGDEFVLPPASRIDGRLVIGAALFGAGWGALGICPGPGLVSLASAQATFLQFIAAMVAGMAITRYSEPLLGALEQTLALKMTSKMNN